MAIRIACVHCGATVEAAVESAGKLARCGKCLGVITVPRRGDDKFAHPPGVSMLPFTQSTTKPPRISRRMTWTFMAAGVFFVGLCIYSAVDTRPERPQYGAATDAVRQYGIVKRNGNVFEAYAYAKLASAAFLEANDENNYRKWKAIENADAKLAGIWVPADTRKAEEFQRYQESLQRSTMDDLIDTMKLHRNDPPPAQPGRPPATEAPGPNYAAKLKAAQEKSRLAEPHNVDQPPPPIANREEPTTYDKALASAKYRRWSALGGTPASEAKIVGYDNGKITVEKRDGKTTVLRMPKLGKADRDYVQKWLDDAAL